ncbi:hypothetical protein CHUAL_007046 [Chamberlinius hualienensis]
MTINGGMSCFYDAYTNLWNLRDKRLDGWLFMDSVFVVLFIVGLYFTLVYYGPKWMQDRKPFKLKAFMFIYNVSIASFNFYISIKLTILTYRQQYNWICEPIRESLDPEEMEIIRICYLYLLSKAIELLDTMFMILKKKSNQLSFLHVYHHTTILLLTWGAIRWSPGGSVAFVCLVNSFIHVIMYGYYSITIFGPSMARYLWWKRYITIIQLFQFGWGCTFSINMIINGCAFPTWLQYVGVFYLAFYIFLFGKFYKTTYLRKKNYPSIYSNGYQHKQQENSSFLLTI